MVDSASSRSSNNSVSSLEHGGCSTEAASSNLSDVNPRKSAQATRPGLSRGKHRWRQPSVLGGLMEDVVTIDSKHKKNGSRIRMHSGHSTEIRKPVLEELVDLEELEAQSSNPGSTSLPSAPGWSIWKDEIFEVGEKAIEHQPTESERLAIEKLCKQLSPRMSWGFTFGFLFPTSTESRENLRTLSVSKEALTNFMLDSKKIRKLLIGTGMELNEELVSEVMKRAADTCLDEYISHHQAYERIVAATNIITKYAAKHKTGRGYNPDALEEVINCFNGLIKDRMFFDVPGLEKKVDLFGVIKKLDITTEETKPYINSCRAAGVLLGMTIAARHGYVVGHEKTKQEIRNVTAFGVCCLWAWSYVHPVLPLVAAVVVSSFAAYELFVPNLKSQFDINKLKFNIHHAALKEKGGFNKNVEEGVNLALFANSVG